MKKALILYATVLVAFTTAMYSEPCWGSALAAPSMFQHQDGIRKIFLEYQRLLIAKDQALYILNRLARSEYLDRTRLRLTKVGLWVELCEDCLYPHTVVEMVNGFGNFERCKIAERCDPCTKKKNREHIDTLYRLYDKYEMGKILWRDHIYKHKYFIEVSRYVRENKLRVILCSTCQKTVRIHRMIKGEGEIERNGECKACVELKTYAGRLKRFQEKMMEYIQDPKAGRYTMKDPEQILLEKFKILQYECMWCKRIYKYEDSMGATGGISSGWCSELHGELHMKELNKDLMKEKEELPNIKKGEDEGGEAIYDKPTLILSPEEKA